MTTLTGIVKWFNNRAGFGFVTVLDGEKKGDDVFAHHSGLNVSSEQYKYLVQGEYVSFTIKESGNSEHPFQAGDVTGVLGGKLMCETRMENRREGVDDLKEGGGRGTNQSRRGGRRGSHGDNRRGGNSRDGNSRDGNVVLEGDKTRSQPPHRERDEE
mgnify:CR=1 FL=1